MLSVATGWLQAWSESDSQRADRRSALQSAGRQESGRCALNEQKVGPKYIVEPGDLKHIIKTSSYDDTFMIVEIILEDIYDYLQYIYGIIYTL